MSSYRVSFTDARRYTVTVAAKDDADAVQRAAAEYRAHRPVTEWERDALRGVPAISWESVERVGGYDPGEAVPCARD